MLAVYTRLGSVTYCRYYLGLAEDHESYFRYTSGRWLFNEKEQLATRYVRFNVEAMKTIACKAVGAQSCTSFTKLGEGTYNKAFLLTFDNDSEAVVRIPFRIIDPIHLVTASEVATMDFIRTVLKIPAPRVLSWASKANSTPVGSAFIVMEKMPGVSLADRWFTHPDAREMVPMVRDILFLEDRFFKARFASFGSLYYKHDVSPDLQNEKLYSDDSETREGEDRFRIGPSVQPVFWRGERGDLDIDRGPWKTAASYAVAVARCEQQWIRAHAKPRAYRDPFCTSHSPAVHIEWLDHAIRAFQDPHLIPDDSLHCPILWHPDLSLSNIMVQASPSPMNVTGLIDWQHAWAGPATLLSEVPHALVYSEGVVSLTSGPRPVPLPDGYESLPEDEKLVVKWDKARADMHKYYKLLISKRYPLRQEISLRPQVEYVSTLLDAAGRSWAHSLVMVRQTLVALQILWPDLYPGTRCPIELADHTLQEYMRDHEILQRYLAARQSVEQELQTNPEDYAATQARCRELEKRWDVEAYGGQFPWRDGQYSSTLLM
ncbi:hypothetical protein BS47DRAFT_1300007 [Hydnum rufescens UP504]|uniref:Altered inheritance of mitochondria protein 9, mitochondrial n=1 Tax=Hydnum rufescens UP504 TaxID=1448309 RepID=A0A9P6ASI4_9AGAM|nr:hypothetical protein BS47DRAFT_1300007 [Hydnum rufescens UP504]